MRKNHHKIYGVIMRPVSMTTEGNEEVIMSCKDAISENFRDVYNDHIGTMQIIAEAAKVYINNNWKKVKDWSNLEIVLKNGNDGTETSYYSFKEETGWADNGPAQSIKKMMEESNKERHNPMPQITEVVLDPTDGDFSINLEDGSEHWWLYDDAVIVIADYIEEQTTKDNDIH